MGSPSPSASFRLVQIGVGGVAQNAYLLYDTATSIGRERGDLVFPRDRFMSGKHAEVVARTDGHYYLVDKGSSNGTWLKLWEPAELSHGDRILVGQQTFRVEAS
jgi:pSer/pThr/pTyr-binding forkhead associated (FHA) protein